MTAHSVVQAFAFYFACDWCKDFVREVKLLRCQHILQKWPVRNPWDAVSHVCQSLWMWASWQPGQWFGQFNPPWVLRPWWIGDGVGLFFCRPFLDWSAYGVGCFASRNRSSSKNNMIQMNRTRKKPRWRSEMLQGNPPGDTWRSLPALTIWKCWLELEVSYPLQFFSMVAWFGPIPFWGSMVLLWMSWCWQGFVPDFFRSSLPFQWVGWLTNMGWPWSPSQVLWCKPVRVCHCSWLCRLIPIVSPTSLWPMRLVTLWLPLASPPYSCIVPNFFQQLFET